MRCSYYLLPVILVLMVVGHSSCELSDEEIESQAREVYQQKVSALILKKEQECKQEIDRKASMIVDSLLRQMRIHPLNQLPYRPTIPERPEFIEVDSSVLISKHSVKPPPD